LAVDDMVASALCGVMERALIAEGIAPAIAKQLSQRACHPVVGGATRAVAKRGKKVVSKYNKELGKQLKKLKAKHPRTAISGLMKRAHKATKRALK